MSIPKEPRQLMITIMYLVLTAMLALNVSAKIMNAFFKINDSLATSASIAAKGSDEVKAGLTNILDKKPNIKPAINGGLDANKALVDDFHEYIEGIKNRLIDESGDNNGTTDEGDYDEKTGLPKGKKNKDVTTRMLVTGDYGNEGKKEPIGPQIQERVQKLRQDLVAVFRKTITDKNVMQEGGLTTEEVEKRIKEYETSLQVQIDTVGLEPGETWTVNRFKQMPVAAVLPLLTKIQADARNGQVDAANKFASLVGGREIKLDKFFPIMNAEKGYVIKGEKFNAKVAIGAYSAEFAKNASISVNGQNIALKDGEGTFTETAGNYGKRTLNMKATVKNPLTGKVMTGQSNFEYEVGERSAAVSLDKMNVFYIGVDNPVSVSVAGANSNKINVSGSGVTVNKSGSGYVVRASAPGNASLTVSAEGFSKKFDYRVKRIPDPVAKLGKSSGGNMGTGEFKAQARLIPDLENFDFEARCEIMGFEFQFVPNREDAVVISNPGGTFSGAVKAAMNRAKPGDRAFFTEIKAKCPGDPAGRKINTIAIAIK